MFAKIKNEELKLLIRYILIPTQNKMKSIFA